MITEAVLLCGGKGTRLRPLTENVPKALIDYKGLTLLQRQTEWLLRHGIKKIILATGHMSEKIEEFVKALDYNVEFVISKESESIGTAGAINLALHHIEGRRFVAANVDDLNDINIGEVAKLPGNVICLSQARLPFGAVITDNGFVKKFEEKPLLNDVWVSMGVYILEKSLRLPESGSIEYDVVPQLRLGAYKHTGHWKTINALKDLED